MSIEVSTTTNLIKFPSLFTKTEFKLHQEQVKAIKERLHVFSLLYINHVLYA